MSTVLVTGGTGQVGRELVPLLHAAGHSVRIASRSLPPTDAPAGGWVVVHWPSRTGLEVALSGVDTVIHLASGSSRGERQTIAALLPAAAEQLAPPSVIYLSIVGLDSIPISYYRAKVASEQALSASGLTFTIQRATQFHPLVCSLLSGLAKPPVMLVPRGVRFQPIDLEPVAKRLVELVDTRPAGRVDDLGGPEIRTVGDLATAYLGSSRQQRRVVEVPLPGRAMAAVRSGANLTPHRAHGSPTFEEYLAARHR